MCKHNTPKIMTLIMLLDYCIILYKEPVVSGYLLNYSNDISFHIIALIVFYDTINIYLPSCHIVLYSIPLLLSFVGLRMKKEMNESRVHSSYN